MESEQFDLFVVLLRLKSYLVSLIDTPDDCKEDFEYTIEYLDRKYPGRREEVISLLRENEIEYDCDIVFDGQIHLKFKEMALGLGSKVDIETLLKNLDLFSQLTDKREKELDKMRFQRESKLQNIVTLLIYLVRIWNKHKDIEVSFDDFVTLDEEEVIRPEERKKLDVLGKDTSLSFDNISGLTKQYIELFTDYYFNYGGNVSLEQFLRDLDSIKKTVTDNYQNLFKKHGLDPDLNDEN